MAARIGRPKNSERLPEEVRVLYKTPFWQAWVNLRRRCTSPKYINWGSYGGRGISYTPRWDVFANFYDDMYANWKPGLELDRINNNGNYEPENCRWVEPFVNKRNMSTNRRFAHSGHNLLLSEWSELTGIKRSTLAQRIYVYKWPLERALETQI